MKDKKFGLVTASDFGVIINLEKGYHDYEEFVSFQVAEKLYNDLGKALKHLKRKMKENDSNKLHTCTRTNQ